VTMQPWLGGQGPMRASNADRERAVDVLKAAFSEGRLTQAEYEQRMDRAYRSKTYGELTAIVADLPQGPMPTPMVVPVAPPPPMMRGPVPPPVYLAPPRPTNGYAIGSLLCGIGSLMCGVTSIPAVILGHVAKDQLKKGDQDGDGMATAGLVMGYLAIFGWGLIWVLAAIS
jgi:Domain of unknown function (DUF1707)/Domain of unknown function (DUF4190)